MSTLQKLASDVQREPLPAINLADYVQDISVRSAGSMGLQCSQLPYLGRGSLSRADNLSSATALNRRSAKCLRIVCAMLA